MIRRTNTPRTRSKIVRDEAGLAMIIVMAVVMLLTLIPLAIFTQSLQQLPLARHDQDHESALAAAEAGVDDYLNRLNQNSNYWTYNATNLPGDGNQAFTTFVPVAGPSNNNESFRYTPDTTKTPISGTIYLTSTGKSRNVMRTVKVGIRRQGFLDFLYLTDYEIVDPALSGDPSSCHLPGVAVEREPQQLRARPFELQHRLLDRRRGAQRTRAHQRRAVRVRLARLQRRHRHLLQLADQSERDGQHALRRTRRHAQPARLYELAVLQPQQRSRERREPAVPAREHVDPNPGRRRGRRHRAACTPVRPRSRCTTPGTWARWTS